MLRVHSYELATVVKVFEIVVYLFVYLTKSMLWR